MRCSVNVITPFTIGFTSCLQVFVIPIGISFHPNSFSRSSLSLTVLTICTGQQATFLWLEIIPFGAWNDSFVEHIFTGVARPKLPASCVPQISPSQHSNEACE
ncbi:unnamed protein product [Protopolystoma xenopodis]|uniref:Uncharacterized protein n=1 Tax=Protopolystoma xenopodis TaxID=117903 RepID=A0A3S5ABB6_9PLAT|nr:unnamed protein product [Protopolystoma xenopodis]